MAHGDLAAMRPAADDLAMAGRAIVIGWLSRGDGAPLELITTMGGQADHAAGSRARPAGPAVISPAEGAAPLLSGGAVADVPPAAGIGRGKHAAPPRISVAPVPEPLLFPPGAWGLPVAAGCADDLDRLVWVPCLAVRGLGPQRPEPVSGPTLFETALVALMRRPFGWLVVAEPASPDEAAGAREAGAREGGDPDEEGDHPEEADAASPNGTAAVTAGCGASACWPAPPDRTNSTCSPRCSPDRWNWAPTRSACAAIPGRNRWKKCCRSIGTIPATARSHRSSSRPERSRCWPGCPGSVSPAST